MKKLSYVIILGLLFIVTNALSCRRQPSNEKRFDLKGKVLAVEPDKHLVTIAHEDIKDYMPGMTMPFTDPDDADFQFLAAGDEIAAILVVDGAHSWLENVQITKESADASASVSRSSSRCSDARLSSESSRLRRAVSFVRPAGATRPK